MFNIFLPSSSNFAVFLLLIFFGSSTWLCINGVWMELSIYAVQLPESWHLPNWLATFIEIACISPFFYAILLSKFPSAAHSLPKAPLIFGILSTSSLAILLLAFCWHQTFWFFGSSHSLPLIGLTFLMALGSALSNVVFLPYLAQFPSNFLPIYFVGMSFSSSIPSFLKLVQGVGDFECPNPSNRSSPLPPIFLPPGFSVQIFNLALFLWMCISTLSFSILHFGFTNSVKIRKANFGGIQRAMTNELGPQNWQNRGRWRFALLAASIGLVSALMNNVLPSVQSFATLPYSLLTYHLALTFSNLAHTFANLFALFAHPRRLAVLLPLVSLCLLTSAFIFALALQSPDPMFRASNSQIGSFIAISLSVLTAFLCSFLRTHLTSLIRQEHSAKSERYLLLCGIFMQIGSVSGAILMFFLVNVFQIFKKRLPCT